MDRERIEQIGKFLESKMVIHRNVEHNSTWTTEEKMIVDLYDNYLDLKIENNKQKEVIKKIMYKIENYTTLNEPRIRKELLDILKEVSE